MEIRRAGSPCRVLIQRQNGVAVSRHGRQLRETHLGSAHGKGGKDMQQMFWLACSWLIGHG
jgi:hypothetical protein